MLMMFLIALVVLATHVAAKITNSGLFEGSMTLTQYIYDKSPKIRIRGFEFHVGEQDISLGLSASGQPTLIANKDYLIIKDPEGGLILQLLGNRKWADLRARVPPVALVLFSVKVKGNNKNLIPDPITIAQVLSTPTVYESNQRMYQSDTNELIIKGSGFIGAKAVNFYFEPPLVKEVAYEDVTKYPLQKDQIVLRLRPGYTWRGEAGPLKIIGVDTGGGPVKVGENDGILIRNVVEKLSVTVENTAYHQLVYADEPNLIITGSGFNPVKTTLRFSNGLLGNGVDYTTESISETSISIHLAPGAYWRKNLEHFPEFLTLLAVDVGEGFVPVGSTNSSKGRDIAMVFPRLSLHSGYTIIYRTQSREFHIRGTGFPLMSSSYKPILKFSPPLSEGVDYSLRVVDSTDLEVTLLDGRAWRSVPGPLAVTAINTLGSRWVMYFGKGVHVAYVVTDPK